MVKYINIIKALLVTGVTLSSLVACGTVVFDEQKIACEVTPPLDSSQRSPALEVLVNVDGSSSMLGYVNLPNSHYIQTLDILDRVFSSQEPVTYYRIGTIPEGDRTGRKQLNSRQDFRKAQFPEFYNGSNPRFPQITSSLDKSIVPPADKNRLLVLVTDLEQNEGDVTNLKNQIEKYYLQDKSKNYAVGILGIKSEFNGKVTPVSRGYSPFKHQGKRPFYLIFVAPYPDLLYYYNQIKNSNLGEHEFSIFHPRGVVSQASLLNGKDSLPDGLSNQPSLYKDRVALELKTPPYNLIELDNRTGEKLEKNPTKLPFHPLEHSVLPRTDNLEIRYKAKAYDARKEDFLERAEDAKLKQAIEFQDWQLPKQDELQFKTIIRPQNFTEPGLYLITADVIVNDLENAPWWSDWDWSSRKDKQDGTKTYGLLNFTDNLKRTTLNLMAAEPATNRIGRLCYGVLKN
jgi:hypothetical protein